MLVAPVLDPSGNRTIYLPPGKWLDFFTGRRFQGDTTFTAHYAVDETPVFVQEGTIIPEQSPAAAYSEAQPLDRLIINVYGSGNGSFNLYEDDGSSLNYEAQHAHTHIAHTAGSDGQRLTIEATQGQYEGQPPARSYQLRILGTNQPSSISVNGQAAPRWTWDAQHAIAVVELPSQSIRTPVRVEWR